MTKIQIYLPQETQLYEVGSALHVLIPADKQGGFHHQGSLDVSNPEIMLLMDGTARIVVVKIEGNILQGKYYFDIDTVQGVRGQLSNAPEKPSQGLII